MGPFATLLTYVAIGMPILMIYKAFYVVRALRDRTYSWKPIAVIVPVFAFLSLVGFYTVCHQMSCRLGPISFGWIADVALSMSPGESLFAGRAMRLAMVAYVVMPLYIGGHLMGAVFYILTRSRHSPG